MTKEEEANAQNPGVIRIDASGNERKPPSCCMCLDVRIGTVMIGLFNLVTKFLVFHTWILKLFLFLVLVIIPISFLSGLPCILDCFNFLFFCTSKGQ